MDKTTSDNRDTVDGFKILHQLIGFPPSKVVQDKISIHRMFRPCPVDATRSQGDGYQFDSGNHEVSSCITGTVSRDWTLELDDTYWAIFVKFLVNLEFHRTNDQGDQGQTNTLNCL